MQLSRYIKIFSGTVVAVLWLTACHSEGEPTSSAQDVAPTPDVASAPLEAADWLLSYEADCAAIPLEQCKGAYGFSVESDGSYRIGPAPGQQVVMGKIDEHELQELNIQVTALYAVEEDRATPPEHCTLQATRIGRKKCVQDERLLKPLEALVVKYHPDVFPNSCVGAALAFEKETAPMKACDHDSDCAYFRHDFIPFESDSPSSVIVDDCTYVRPLSVANAFLVVSNQLKLLIQRDIALQICGDAVAKPACAHSMGFDPHSASPVCVNRVCQIPSAVQIHSL